MASYPTHLTRRSFSTWLTASGLALVTSRLALSQDSIEFDRVYGEAWNEIEEDVSQLESSLTVESGYLSQESQAGHLPLAQSESPQAIESYGQVSLERRSRDGRPPSEWLRSMETEELRSWLATIEVSEATVHGMTFWTHLTRDHMFTPLLIKGLTESEQAKLHAAAHFGY